MIRALIATLVLALPAAAQTPRAPTRVPLCAQHSSPHTSRSLLGVA